MFRNRQAGLLRTFSDVVQRDKTVAPPASLDPALTKVATYLQEYATGYSPQPSDEILTSLDARVARGIASAQRGRVTATTIDQIAAGANRPGYVPLAMALVLVVSIAIGVALTILSRWAATPPKSPDEGNMAALTSTAVSGEMAYQFHWKVANVGSTTWRTEYFWNIMLQDTGASSKPMYDVPRTAPQIRVECKYCASVVSPGERFNVNITLLASRNYDPRMGRFDQPDSLNRYTYTYDRAGNRTQVVDAQGLVTKYVYDTNGRVVETTDANNHTSKFAYDTKGRLVRVDDPLGFTTHYTYDADDRVATITDGHGRTTSYDYNSRGQLLRITSPIGAVTSYVYDGRGNRIRMVDERGRLRTYIYDSLDRVVSVTDYDGRALRYTYNDEGELAKMVDTNGRTVIYNTDHSKDTVAYTYDAVSNRLRATDSEGNEATYTYVLNNPASQIDLTGSATLYSNDTAFEVSVTDKMLDTTRFEYDAQGNLIAAIHPSGNVVPYPYAMGNRSQWQPYAPDVLFVRSAG